MEHKLSILFASVFAFALIVVPDLANAGAVASIYNGAQFNLAGQVLVQDADVPSDFYIIPQTYTLKRESTYDEKTGEFGQKVWMQNRVATEGGQKYSVYGLRFALDEPSQEQLLKATFLLRRKTGLSAQIKGLAPICGMSLSVPGEGGAAVSPNATVVTYSIKSTTAGECKSIVSTTEFNMEIRVPIAKEPEMARAMMSEVGLVLPPIQLTLPYKYKDKVSLSVDAKSFFNQVKSGVGASGSWKAVTASVRSNVSKAMNTLQIGGLVDVDCQNPDKSVCDKFVDRALQHLSEILVKYVPLGTTDAGHDPLIVADKDKAVSANAFRVDMAFDEATAEKMGKFKIDFQHTGYDSISSEVQLDVSGVPETSIDPEIRAMIGTVL